MTMSLFSKIKLISRRFPLVIRSREFCDCRIDRACPSYITSPIFYVNGSPHIGHLYTAVLCDAFARYRRLNGDSHFLFSIGTDEHGFKIQKAAEERGLHPEEFCRNFSGEFKQLFDACEVSYSRFIRTTDCAHIKAVDHFWKVLESQSYIYPSSYSGWYSLADEMFIPEVKTNVDLSGTRYSTESGHSVEWISEQNYLFRLSSFAEKLTDWIKTIDVKPAIFKSHLQSLVMDCVEKKQDVSVSRPASRLKWGIPVPGNPSQTIYVWLDALVNYLTAVGYPATDPDPWPPIHVLGKDILTFHGVFWPAFLMGAGLEPPRHFVVHSHWLVEDVKMSKSLGNVINPSDHFADVTADGWRYFLLREGVPHSDGNFTWTKMKRLLNAELADHLGNLLMRCTTPAINKTGVSPVLSADEIAKELPTLVPVAVKLWQTLNDLPDTVAEHYEDFQFYRGLNAIQECLRLCNSFFQAEEPWKLAKDPKSADKLKLVLTLTFETLRVSALLLQPIVPGIAAKVLDKLAVPENDRSLKSLVVFPGRRTTTESTLPEKKFVLFQKLR